MIWGYHYFWKHPYGKLGQVYVYPGSRPASIFSKKWLFLLDDDKPLFKNNGASGNQPIKNGGWTSRIYKYIHKLHIIYIFILTYVYIYMVRSVCVYLDLLWRELEKVKTVFQMIV